MFILNESTSAKLVDGKYVEVIKVADKTFTVMDRVNEYLIAIWLKCMAGKTPVYMNHRHLFGDTWDNDILIDTKPTSNHFKKCFSHEIQFVKLNRNISQVIFKPIDSGEIDELKIPGRRYFLLRSEILIDKFIDNDYCLNNEISVKIEGMIDPLNIMDDAASDCWSIDMIPTNQTLIFSIPLIKEDKQHTLQWRYKK